MLDHFSPSYSGNITSLVKAACVFASFLTIVLTLWCSNQMTGIQIRGFNFLMQTHTMKKAYPVEFSFNLTKRNLALYL
jgi:hypothetical protein